MTEEIRQGVAAFFAACNTTSASRLTLWLVNRFGRRRTIETGQAVIELAKWRGRDYLIDYRPAKEQAKQ